MSGVSSLIGRHDASVAACRAKITLCEGSPEVGKGRCCNSTMICLVPCEGKCGGEMFGRGVALVLGALLLCSCQTTERHGLDYAAMTQKVGPPKAGHARIVMLREKTFSIVDAGSRFELDGEPIRGLKTGTYVYADRPAGPQRFTA